MPSPGTSLEPVLQTHIERRLERYAKLLPKRMLVRFRKWSEDMISTLASDPDWMKPLRDLPPVKPEVDYGEVMKNMPDEAAERLLAELGFAFAKRDVARKDDIADHLADHASMVAFGIMQHVPDMDGHDPETCSRELSRLLDMIYACLFAGMLFGFKALPKDKQTRTSEYLWAAMAFQDVIREHSARDAKLLMVYFYHAFDIEEVAERKGVPFSTEQAEVFGFLERFGASLEAAAERITPHDHRPGDRLKPAQIPWVLSAAGKRLKSGPRRK
jgi:hypothetical protein